MNVVEVLKWVLYVFLPLGHLSVCSVSVMIYYRRPSFIDSTFWGRLVGLYHADIAGLFQQFFVWAAALSQQFFEWGWTIALDLHKITRVLNEWVCALLIVTHVMIARRLSFLLGFDDRPHFRSLVPIVFWLFEGFPGLGNLTPWRSRAAFTLRIDLLLLIDRLILLTSLRLWFWRCVPCDKPLLCIPPFSLLF